MVIVVVGIDEVTVIDEVEVWDVTPAPGVAEALPALLVYHQQ
jgi:hypothetical protein